MARHDSNRRADWGKRTAAGVRNRIGATACVAAAAAAAAVALPGGFARADQTKADNTTNLDVGGSWVSSTAPGPSDLAIWSGTYNTAGGLSAAFTAGSQPSWLGIQVAAVSGAAVNTSTNTIYIGGTGATASGVNLSIGAGGINLSAANQSVVVNDTSTVIGASQTWNVASGLNVRFGDTGTGAANANLSGGTASTVITIAGGGVVDLNEGGASGFSDAGGFTGYAGQWVVDSGATLRGLRNGATAFGSNSAANAITLNGGTLAVGGIAGAVGNWTWNTNLTLAPGTTSAIDEQNVSGTGRYLKLNQTITGNGTTTLVFKDTAANSTFTNIGLGYILTGANNMSAGSTIVVGGPNENGIAGRLTVVRVGGVNGTNGTDTTTGAGPGGSLGAASVVDNGILTFDYNTSSTVANNISGTGMVNVGVSGDAQSGNQSLTLAGSNTFTGGMTLANGFTTFGTAASLPASGSINVASGASVVAAGYYNTPAAILGSGRILPSSAGAIALASSTSTNVDFTGYNNLSLSALGVVTYGGTITPGGNGFQFGGSGAANNLIVSGNLSGGAAVNVSVAGLGTVTLAGTNSYTGGTNVNGTGFLRVSGASPLGTGTVSFNAGGSLGAANGSAGATVSNPVFVNTGVTANLDATYAPLTLSNAISDNSPNAGLSSYGNVQKVGPGTVYLTASNSYAGATYVSQGTLDITNGVLGGQDNEGAYTSSLGDLGNVVFNGTLANGTLAYANQSEFGPVFQIRFRNTGGTAGTGGDLLYVGVDNQTVGTTIQCDTSIGIRLDSNSATGSVSYNGPFQQTNRPLYLGGSGPGPNTIANSYTGTGAVTKTGVGTWVLSASNAYTGATNVSAGTLVVTGATATGSTVTVGAGATLAGTGTVGGTVAVLGTITGGSGATAGGTVGTLTTGNQAWNTGGGYVAKVTNTAGSNDVLVLSGLTVGSGFGVTLQPTTGSSPTFTATNPTLTAAPVAGSYIVLVKDSEASGTNPFASQATLAALNLTLANDGVKPQKAGDPIQLATEADGGGFDLIAEDVAAPEPASVVLAAAAVTPLALGRRRRRDR